MPLVPDPIAGLTPDQGMIADPDPTPVLISVPTPGRIPVLIAGQGAAVGLILLPSPARKLVPTWVPVADLNTNTRKNNGGPMAAVIR